jgi:hypothetical protein
VFDQATANVVSPNSNNRNGIVASPSGAAASPGGSGPNTGRDDSKGTNKGSNSAPGTPNRTPEHTPVLGPTQAPHPESAPESASLYSPEKYRLTFIGHLLQLQSPARCLKYLDMAYVTEDEIIRGLKELGINASDREMFRFNSIVFGKDTASLSLSLAGRKLQRGDFLRFPQLTQLDLSKNLYNDDTIIESHLPALKRTYCPYCICSSSTISHNDLFFLSCLPSPLQWL